MTALDSVIRSNAFRSRPRLRMSSLPSAMRGTQAKWIYSRLRLFNDYRSKPPKRSRISGPNAGSLTTAEAPTGRSGRGHEKGGLVSLPLRGGRGENDRQAQ